MATETANAAETPSTGRRTSALENWVTWLLWLSQSSANRRCYRPIFRWRSDYPRAGTTAWVRLSRTTDQRGRARL